MPLHPAERPAWYRLKSCLQGCFTYRSTYLMYSVDPPPVLPSIIPCQMFILTGYRVPTWCAFALFCPTYPAAKPSSLHRVLDLLFNHFKGSNDPFTPPSLSLILFAQSLYFLQPKRSLHHLLFPTNHPTNHVSPRHVYCAFSYFSHHGKRQPIEDSRLLSRLLTEVYLATWCLSSGALPRPSRSLVRPSLKISPSAAKRQIQRPRPSPLLPSVGIGAIETWQTACTVCPMFKMYKAGHERLIFQPLEVVLGSKSPRVESHLITFLLYASQTRAKNAYLLSLVPIQRPTRRLSVYCPNYEMLFRTVTAENAIASWNCLFDAK